MTSTKAPYTGLIQPGSHVLIAGLGKSGFSAAKFMKKLGARVSVSESSSSVHVDGAVKEWLAEHDVFLESGGHTAALFETADLILASPGVPLDAPALKAARLRNIPIIGELALAASYLKTPLAAVTGTNGKSTVTTLIGELCRAAGKKVFVGGNIGVPLTDYLAGPQDAEVVVLEVSSFQLDTAGSFKPDVAVLLNISPDHLDRYASYEAYAASKFRIFANQGREGAAILGLDDDEIVHRQHLWPKSRCCFFGRRLDGRCGATFKGQEVIVSKDVGSVGNDERYDLSGGDLGVSPNLENAMAAILAARLLGCPQQAIQQGLAGFRPLPHRLALVAEIDGVTYYDDSKATNIGAVRSALEGMGQPVVLIAGGRDKQGGYDLLAQAVRDKVKGMLLIGEAKEHMGNAFEKLTRVELMAGLKEAVCRAAEIAAPGDAVLLSPACASFDMFSGYAQRGEVFREAVSALKRKAAADGACRAKTG